MPMSIPLAAALCVLVSYLVGGIPFGYIIGRVVGIDIRKHGSGNIGATNVARVVGAKWGLAVLIPDCLKGLLPVWAVTELLPMVTDVADADAVEVVHVMVLCGVAAIVGHMYSCWIGFRGGKGVATALGVALILSTEATLAAGGVYLLVLAIRRLPSLSSLAGAGTFAVVQTALMTLEGDFIRQWSLSAFTLAVPVLIVYAHRTNIRRILDGTEVEFQFRRGPQVVEGEDGQAESE